MKNNYACEQFEETTLLNPVETRFNMDCELYDCSFVDRTNRNGLYMVQFGPASNVDFQLFDRAKDKALDCAWRDLSPFSNKELELAVYDRDDFISSSQLFAPKVNMKYDNSCELDYRKASITGHFRDAPDGKIYLNIEYIDVYAIQQSPEVIDHLVKGNLTEQEIEDSMF